MSDKIKPGEPRRMAMFVEDGAGRSVWIFEFAGDVGGAYAWRLQHTTPPRSSWEEAAADYTEERRAYYGHREEDEVEDDQQEARG